MKKFILHVLADFLLVTILVFSYGAGSIYSHVDSAFAEELNGSGSDGVVSYPYTGMFTISAYYSPLPCQSKYATGSYEGDIRLNGSGVRGADGTPVYPGMIAAPKSYAFGTKMDIPGVGLVAVHDRGGAIKSYSGVNGVYDRLDIWMGYGDKGLERALKWGKRNVEVVVYGQNDSLKEQITLPGYSESEKVPNQCVYEEPNSFAEITFDTEPKVVRVEEEKSEFFAKDLKFGDSGPAVRQLQEELTSVNLYRGPLTGYYGELTEHAVFKFQQTQSLVLEKGSPYAGVFGPKTRDRLNEIVSARIYTGRILAEASETKTIVVEKVEEDIQEYEEKESIIAAGNDLLAVELNFGDTGQEVKLLQEFLKDEGYFSGFLITDYFGPITKASVLKFQIEQGIVDNKDDQGAGRVGPATLQAINTYYS